MQRTLHWQVLSLCVLGAVSGARAAEVSQAPGDEESKLGPRLEEVVVTAQKREERIQDTPLTIAAFSDEMIKQTGISSATQLGIMTPGLTMTQSGSGVLPYIRGIGAASAAGGQESPVAIYLDGVYFQQGYASDLALSNIERIEVLKGPQGTLFGRNVTGGLIHIITKDPSAEPAADVRVAAGNYEIYEAEFYGTTGITENIAADISVRFQDQGKGFGKNTFLDKRGFYRDELTARSKWKYSGDRTDATLSFYYMNIDSDKGQFRYVPEGSVAVGGIVHTGGFWDNQSDVEDNTNFVDSKGISLRLEHRFDTMNLLSISAYNDQRADTPIFDNDFSSATILNAGLNNVTKYFTQELQLTSNNTDGNSWIVGLYFMDSYSRVDLSLSSVGGLFSTGKMDTTSWAAFGEYTWRFTDKTRATAGVRYTRDKRDISGERLGAPIPKDDHVWKEPTYRAVLQHDWSDDTMLYASYTRGFKSGNYNVVSPTSAPVDPEFIDAYEVGMKSSFLDNRLQLNLAAFYYEYDDLQLTVYQGAASLTLNAASAEILGAEASLAAMVTDDLRVDLGVSVLDTEYTKFPNFALQRPRVDEDGNPIGGNLPAEAADVSGNQLQRTPKLTASAGATYTFDVGSGDVTTSLRASYTKGFPWEPDGRLREDDYVVVNLNVGWRSKSDTWGFGIIGRNIFEEKYALSRLATAPNDNMSPAEPATFSVYFDYSF
jgi:iron complex outermembrane receptor protein